MSVYLQDGRHQEEDAGHEAGEGQRHGPGRRLRAAGQGRQPQSREGKKQYFFYKLLPEPDYLPDKLTV